MESVGSLFTETRGRTSDGKSGEYLDKRIIRGYLFVWNIKDLYGTKFIKGCCARSIRDRGPESGANYKITFLWQHDQSDPLALFAILEEDDYGLYFETKPLDDVPNAKRTIDQIRSGTLNQFSGGFDYIWDAMEYDANDDSIVCKEIELFEGSVVTIGGQPQTFAIRSVDSLAELAEDTDFFIRSLSRQKQMEARALFTRHKSMIDTGALEQGNKGTTVVSDDEKAKQKRSLLYKNVTTLLKNKKETT